VQSCSVVNTYCVTVIDVLVQPLVAQNESEPVPTTSASSTLLMVPPTADDDEKSAAVCKVPAKY